MLDLLRQFDVWAAFRTTLLLTVLAAAGSLILGTVVAILRVSPVKLLQRVGATFVQIFVNTPLTLIIVAANIVMIVNLGLSVSSDIVWDNLIWAVIGLSFYHAAFVCEALRSGVNTVPLGQAEAARSLGLTFSESLREVILPQAFRGAVTPLGNTLIALTKNTTVATAIGVSEASGLMREMLDARADLVGPIFALIAIGFVVITLPMGMATTWLSRRWVVKR